MTVERQIGRDFLASAGYVGTRGVHVEIRDSNRTPNGIPRVDQIGLSGFRADCYFPGFEEGT